MPYRCAKFERNRTTGRLILCGSKIHIKSGVKKKKRKEKKNVKKIRQFLEVYIFVTTNPISFKFDM